MPTPPVGPAHDGSFPADCAHTHLFAGARVLIQGLPDPAAFAAAPAPVGLALRLSDGVTVPAELLVADRGDVVLTVAAHTTAAGTPIGERAWQVRDIRVADDDAVEMSVGGRQDAGFPAR
ncbi:hypothetical protein G3I40_18430 [Streptomyces sp. SID14478]|uniref:hypothetical protein n=1 Tax=Streptomyces sp. SID14478 TaxID=2706073 RepID=UPI0013DB864D|nr:hypothetical protein [Streptomyces sp. SID14478]NEB77180.1 hypothetical protein [Streptomyces sp. SID14478]